MDKSTKKLQIGLWSIVAALWSAFAACGIIRRIISIKT